MSWARCSECGQTFNSDYGFDRHRVTTTGQPGYDADYDWRCATEAELLGRGWSKNARGWWITAQMADSARDRRTRTA
jgi:hypothetical protein